MRFILCLLFLVSINSFAQKTPIGLIIQFDENANFAMQSSEIAKVQGLSELQEGHVLNGFDVTLVEGSSVLSVSAYKAIQLNIEKSELVIFTSILYRTNDGAIGGDLPQLYYKLKDGEQIHGIDFFNSKQIEKRKVSSYLNFPMWLCESHHSLTNVQVRTYTKGLGDIRAHQKEMLATGKFEFVSVNTLHTVLATTTDPYLENQWALENDGGALHFDGTAGADMAVVPAWDITTGDPSIKIAVLDSGTDTNHVDLVGNLLPGFDATGDGSKGYPNTEFSNDGHGTCTAGIIGALGDNEEGIAGVAYSCKIIPVKIFYYVEFGGDVIPFSSSSAGTDGIIWAVNVAKADILSNSWGVRDSDIPLLGIDTVMSNMVIAENIASGREGKGTPMLFSSGNEGDSFSIWPASHPHTISVGASTMCDELKTPTDCSPEGWWGSNHGDNLDVTAPGVKVLATDMTDDLGYNGFMDNNYSMFNGTSAACPNAAGVMALILSVDPELSAYDARAVLAVTANKVGGYDYDSDGEFGMWSEEMGYGRVNAYDAVYYASNYVTISEENKVLDRIAYANEQTILVLNDFEQVEVTLFDALGKEVAHIEAGQLAGANVLLNDYLQATGMYIVQIRRGNEVAALKAVVQK
ncbi:MAG: S8 family serine peptidase [Crocinitomix sp.]|nr:S8 family serine peptidase [Crocinitomix sp.]